MDRSNLERVAGGTLAIILCACTGSIGSDDPRGGGPNGVFGAAGAAGAVFAGAGGASGGAAAGGSGGMTAGTDPTTGVPLTCVTPEVGETPMRRITHTEYSNSVRDLLGVTSEPGLALPRDTQIGLFDNSIAAQTVTLTLGDVYLDTAVNVAEDIGDVGALLGCDPAGFDGANCVRGFAERLGRRAYRRPLTTEELAGLMAVHDEARAATDGVTGARAVIASVLASPNFLFKPEFGGEPSSLPSARVATGFELASRLATLLWASVPDDMLLDAAAAGLLATKEQVAVQARRMLESAQARPAVETFYQQWLGLPLLDSVVKDAASFPDWSDGLRDAMRQETEQFIAHVLWQDDARLATLYSASYSIVNASLARLYGASGGPADDATFARTDLDPTQRAGVLTQGAFMASYANPQFSSPIKRGKWIRTRMLCQPLPDPPPNIPAPPPPAPNLSTRERFAMHTDSLACSNCHRLIDGVGFGLENFDGIGKFRTMDGNVPVDSSGQINESDVDEPYSGGVELAALLARSGQARDCLPTQWLRYAMAREEGPEDTCSLVALRQAFAASDGDMRELMVALTQTDAFMSYRQPD
jgi:hypothetical protein